MNRIFQRSDRDYRDYGALVLVGVVFVAMLVLITMPQVVLSPATVNTALTQ
jgi:hypothetical protein